MNSSFFADFAPTDYAQWKAQAIKDLKGKDFDQTLVWNSIEGFDIQPYYTDKDTQLFNSEDIRQHQERKIAGWLNLQTVVFDTEPTTNAQLLGLMTKGVDGFTLDLTRVDVRSVVFPKLLHGIKLSEVSIHFRVKNQSAELVSRLLQFINYQMRGGIADDAHATWAKTGSMTSTHYESLKETIIKTRSSPNFRPITVESHVFHHAGATATQELACALASAVAYIDKLTDLGLPLSDIIPKIQFSVSVGTSYFVEIAKLRALRYLWSVVLEQFGLSNNEAHRLFIAAETSHFFDATSSPHTNLLRATTQSMAAVVGNADALTTHAYDADFDPNNAFSERIARNISILMKEEGHFDKINDPAAGSFYVENLTHQLAQNAWELFLKIEEKGGFVAAFEQNFVQDLIESTHEVRCEALRGGATVMVGVNKFREPENNNPARVTAPSGIVENVPFKLLSEKRISEAVDE